MKQFEGASCALCRDRPSSPTGEHVWPSWFLRFFGPAEGPYSWSVNGEPVLRRDGTKRTHDTMTRVKLPVCVNCNATLNRRFEEPAKPVVRAIVQADGDIALRPDDAYVAALWFLKTWLLLAHPEARFSEPDVSFSAWTENSDDLYSWMIAGEDPPDGLSVWLTKIDPARERSTAKRRIPLPTVVADDRVIQFCDNRVGVRSLDVSLVYHPGWPIAHPQETEGTAVRLWPRMRDQGADLTKVPQLAGYDTAWLKGPTIRFGDRRYGLADLPALSADFHGMPGEFRSTDVTMITW